MRPAGIPALRTLCWAQLKDFRLRCACVQCVAGAEAHSFRLRANIVWTDPADGSDGAILKARELAQDKDRYYYADQYGNQANWKAHYKGTANEIWQQTEGQITHFVAGLGTQRNVHGVTRRLKELNPKIECIAMQPDSPFHGLEGLKYMATAIVPPIYDASVADRHVEQSTEEAYEMAKHLGRNEGLLLGISAAAAVAASLKIGEEEARAGRSAVLGHHPV